MSIVSHITQPSTKGDELAESCGVALAILEDDASVALLCETWAAEALESADSKREATIAAVWHVYGVQLEAARQQAHDHPLFYELTQASQDVLGTINGSERDNRRLMQLRNALFELEGREKFGATQDERERRERFLEVRQHSYERERMLRDRQPTGAGVPVERRKHLSDRSTRDRARTAATRGR